jgi:NADPH-dependent curcumin reductase CurA
VYLATIATIPAGILGKGYDVFIENFVSNLLDALNLNMTEPGVVNEVRGFLVSLNDHCESEETRKNLDVLLSQKVFLQ